MTPNRGHGSNPKRAAARRQLFLLERALRTLGVHALDFFFPRRCAGCSREGRFLCAACLERLLLVRAPWCRQCGRPHTGPEPCSDCRTRPHQLSGIRAPYIYGGTLRQAILQFKYQGVSAFAEELAPLLEAYMRTHPIAADLIAPVPLFRDRQRERGYNQAELLGRRLGGLLSIRCEPAALRRLRRTPPQARLTSWEERRENMAGAFGASPALVFGRRVLVLDDVCTTGATMEACGAALRTAGAVSVWGLALARDI